LELAIARIEPFNAIYEQFRDSRLPAIAVLRDFLIDREMSPENASECVEIFLANGRDLGLVKTYAGAERLLSFEILLEEYEQKLGAVDSDQPVSVVVDTYTPQPVSIASSSVGARVTPASVLAEASDLSSACFLITPIGADGSIERQHADLVYGSLIEPALEGLGFRLIRADRISKPGMITAQIIDHLVRAPLVIADLSFGNPNVFYELALRHARRLPVVQIIRSSDHLPFDVGQFRTVIIDMTDIYSLVPQIDSHRAEIARQCRAALDEGGPAENPLSLFYPQFWGS
jgi:hypothetical protein